MGKVRRKGGEAPRAAHARCLKDAVTLAYHEQELVEQLLTKMKAKNKNVCTGTGCACKQ